MEQIHTKFQIVWSKNSVFQKDSFICLDGYRIIIMEKCRIYVSTSHTI